MQKNVQNAFQYHQKICKQHCSSYVKTHEQHCNFTKKYTNCTAISSKNTSNALQYRQKIRKQHCNNIKYTNSIDITIKSKYTSQYHENIYNTVMQYNQNVKKTLIDCNIIKTSIDCTATSSKNTSISLQCHQKMNKLHCNIIKK